MKPIKVNGVVVHCSDCINHMVSIDDAPCKDCWKVICHAGDISNVCLEDIAFYPKDKEHFLAVEKMVKKIQRPVYSNESGCEGTWCVHRRTL